MVYNFAWSDVGAQTISGTAGTLVNMLDTCLVVNTVFTTADDASFVNVSASARQNDSLGFNMLTTPSSADRIYIGMQQPFPQTRFTLLTGASSAVYVYEYWNGTAWTALSLISDGTSGQIGSGLVTWTLPTNWATTAVSGTTMYWMRLRASTAPASSASIDCLSVTDWQVAYTATSKRAYRANTGNRFYCMIDDTGPLAQTDARIVGYEQMTAIASGTFLFPTAVQKASGLFIRKSATASTSGRVWQMVCDNRTWYLFIVTGDIGGATYNYFGYSFGEFYSLLQSDIYNTMIVARGAENSNVGSAGTEDLCSVAAGTFGATPNHYIPRAYFGTGGGVNCNVHLADAMLNSAGANVGVGQLPYPNPTDGKVYICRIRISDVSTSSMLRGWMRGFYNFGHPVSSVTDGDTITGTGDFAGKSFKFIKATGSSSGTYTMETSNTWDTN